MNFAHHPIRTELAKNAQLHGAGSGKSAFVCATGPSIKLENMQLLSGHDCFSVSNFFLHQDIGYVNPKLHFFAPYHKPLILENYINWLAKADETLPPQTALALGHTTYDLVQQHALFKNRRVFYFYFDPYHDIHGKIDLTKRILSPQTGPLMILPVLIAMGYTTIYLLGCDHTVLRNFKQTVHHFYDRNQDPRINAADNQAWDNIIGELESTKNVFLQYYFYKKIAQEHGIHIINLSQDSWLDMFPIQRLESAIEQIKS
jgi:hypothetical protein